MAPRIGRLELEAFVQATEDEAKVVLALSNLAGRDARPFLEVTRTEGFHKNPLLMLRARFTKEREAGSVLSNLLLSDPFRESLLGGADARLDDDNVFHFRFDKQSACEGILRPHVEGESVKLTMKVLTFPFSREAALVHLRDLGMSGTP